MSRLDDPVFEVDGIEVDPIAALLIEARVMAGAVAGLDRWLILHGIELTTAQFAELSTGLTSIGVAGAKLLARDARVTAPPPGRAAIS